jgi:hypothetical protein
MPTYNFYYELKDVIHPTDTIKQTYLLFTLPDYSSEEDVINISIKDCKRSEANMDLLETILYQE